MRMIDTHAVLAELLVEIDKLDDGRYQPDLIDELAASGDRHGRTPRTSDSHPHTLAG
jgi:hypothetical protein